MEIYYGVIYYKNGNRREVGRFSGLGAAESCERFTASEFEKACRIAVNDYFVPTRYEVKIKEE